MSTRLRAESLTLRYGGAKSPNVVTDVDLDIADSQVTTIIGPNGCGKSTVLRSLARLMRPAGGAVILDGQLIHRYPTKEVARRLGILGQQPVAPAGITVEDLVRRGRHPHQALFQSATRQDAEAIEEALHLTGVSALRGRRVDELSGGQRQRAWIAMSLAQQTELLLLDEPTTFLDIAHQLEVIEVIEGLHRRGRTIVMVLHDLNEAARCSQRLVAMRQGRIVAEGTPQQVLTPELLGELYEIDCEVVTDPRGDSPLAIPTGRTEPAEPPPASLPPVAAGTPPTPPTPAAPVGPRLRARALSTGHPGGPLVSAGLELEFAAGRVTGIIGPNACGKSTLLRTAGRLLKARGGAFLLGDTDTRHGSRRALARRLCWVMQAPEPPAGFLVEDVVAAGRMPHQGPFTQWRERDEEVIADALARCGLGALRFREMDALSGGQRQRAWVAAALAQQSPVMFLDEPTTFLDIGYQLEVLDLVRDLNQHHGRTVVLVLHDLNLAARYCHDIIAMRAGRVLAAGPAAEVLRPEVLRATFDVECALVPTSRPGPDWVIPLRVSSSDPTVPPGTATDPGSAASTTTERSR